MYNTHWAAKVNYTYIFQPNIYLSIQYILPNMAYMGGAPIDSDIMELFRYIDPIYSSNHEKYDTTTVKKVLKIQHKINVYFYNCTDPARA
jgi:hypothetical protein